MTEYRLPWLLAGIACTLLALFVLAVSLMIATMPYCSEKQTVYIGNFGSKEAGVRAAIPKLAAEIARCPDANVYRVMWEGPGNYQGNYRHSVLYERRDNRIGYEDDFLSSFSDQSYVVDDAAIHAVAVEGGMLEDFARYDQRRR
ncbi:MAG TPA: hypothetical protein VFM05_03050 [Candidatus Saccharimonadales bacterium]|nr:hypothetical protein [Candidatus Saccharimonadales bacterium]